MKIILQADDIKCEKSLLTDNAEGFNEIDRMRDSHLTDTREIHDVYALLTPAEHGRLYAELRDPQLLVMPDGGAAFQVGHHPLYGRLVTAHDGERIGLIASRVSACLPVTGHPSDAMRDGGPAWASLVAVGGMIGVQRADDGRVPVP